MPSVAVSACAGARGGGLRSGWVGLGWGWLGWACNYPTFSFCATISAVSIMGIHSAGYLACSNARVCSSIYTEVR